MFTILRNRNYFWLWFGQTISQVGDGIRDWAMIYWVFRASGESPLMMALSFIATMSPSLFLAPVAGVWVDRWDRRRTMIISDLIRAVLSLLLLVVAATGRYGIALGISFLASCVAQFFGPSRSAMIRRVVGQEHLLEANSLASTTGNIITLAMPALGTAIYLYIGARVSFAIDSVSFLLSALCIAMVTASGAVEAAAGASRRFLAELKEGLRFALDSRPLRIIIISLTILMVGAGASNALGLLIIKQSLGLQETAMGYVATVQTLFSLVTALAIGTSARKLRRVALLVPAGLGIAAIGLGGYAGALNIWWVFGAMCLMGVANVVLNLGSGTTMQRLVPDRLIGRVSAVFGMPIVATMLLSAGVAGSVALYVSPRWIMGFSAVMSGLAAIYGFIGLRSVAMPEAQQPPAVEQTGD